MGGQDNSGNANTKHLGAKRARRRFGGVVSIAIGGMSVVALIRHAFDVGFGPVFTAVATEYGRVVEFVTTPFQPLLSELATLLSQWLNLHLDLHSHWRHVFVVVMVYFFKDATASVEYKRPGGTIMLAAIGVPTAIAISLAAGFVQPSHDWTSNFIIAAIAVIGIAFFDLAKLLWYAFFLLDFHESIHGVRYTTSKFLLRYVRYPVGVLAVGMTIAATVLLAPNVQSLPIPGVAVILLLILAYTLWWLGVGLSRALKKAQETGTSWWRLYDQSGPAILGREMLLVFVWAIAFTAIGVGENLLFGP